MDSFTMEVISAIKQIPSGKVSSYGRIARIAGNSRGARQVSRILHTLSKKHNLPWHRVISSTGKIVIQDEQNAILQKELLLNEGVQVSPQNTVDMKIYAIY
ncbi:MAG: MGMT family protein [Candidatus Heimdallarchaeota archaeon]|nr:MGMT family protein [Candidatus Heimdallarchaeota archaeon]